MAEPARKLDRERSAPQPRRGRRQPARVLPLRQREEPERREDTWTLDRIVLWYRIRRD